MSVEKIKKLLVVALRPEWSFLKQKYSFVQDKQLKNLYHISSHPGGALLQIGVGKEFAEKSFSELLKQHTVASVLHFGTAGALVPELKTGDVVVVTGVVCSGLESQSLLCEKTDPIDIPRSELRDSKIVEGHLFTSCVAVTRLEEKQAIAQKTGAVAVDMESLPVAKICQERGIKYAAVRGIFDEANEDIEHLVIDLKPTGEINVKQTVVNVLKAPRAILEISALRKRVGLVNRAMGKVVESFLST